MTKETFEYLYHEIDNVTLTNMYRRGSGSVYKYNNRYEINANFLLRRRDFYSKVWNQAHDNYFKITEHIPDLKLAKILDRFYKRGVPTWNMYLRETLFSRAYQDSSLFNYRINYNLWIFFRITTFMIRRLERYESTKRRS